MTTAELEDTLEQLHGLECAVRAEFLRVASDIHESGSWRADGARDLAEWLAGKFPLSARHARELARVAQALRDLPAIAEAYGDRGPTDLGNLVLLCSYHHQFVHERGWTISGNPMDDLDFIRPDGRTYGVGPPPLRPTTHNQLFSQVA